MQNERQKHKKGLLKEKKQVYLNMCHGSQQGRLTCNVWLSHNEYVQKGKQTDSNQPTGLFQFETLTRTVAATAANALWSCKIVDSTYRTHLSRKHTINKNGNKSNLRPPCNKSDILITQSFCYTSPKTQTQMQAFSLEICAWF